MKPGGRLEWKAWEVAGAALALIAGFHFLAIRIRAGGLPGGDEGSWLSVAAELARGNGFSTRWLEGHFLIPYTLPRPDDFRYPAFTFLLALVFRIFGFSVEAGRWTAALVFLTFSASLWLVCRSAFGRWAGFGALCLSVTSLLQLEWNSVTYTEGLFGLALTGLAAWCMIRSTASRTWWAGLGGLVGALYLVRPNGLLFLPGAAWMYWRLRHTGLSWKRPALAFAAFTLVASPWLIRNTLHFGNPLHVAGNAGMLREPGQPHTYSLLQFLAQHNIFYPFERFLYGIPRFFATLDFYEHGLEVIPLALVPVAAFLRLSAFGPFLACGFALTTSICFYVAYDGWAAVRYMSPLLPFLYAYGLSALPALAAKASSLWLPGPPGRTARLLYGAAGSAGILLLLLPVLHPHRFYERKFAHSASPLADVPDHLRRLEALLPAEGNYYAASLCGVNVLSERGNCIGLQELYDTTWFSRSMEAFRPSLLVLTPKETRDSIMLKAIERISAGGYSAVTLEKGPLAIYFRLARRDALPDADREGGASGSLSSGGKP